MRLGMFPGQIDALRELARKGVDAEKRSRRQFLISVVATVTVGVGAFVAGRAMGGGGGEVADVPPDDVRARWQKKLAWADEFASQPIEQLLERRSTFLMTIEQTGGSEATWKGFARLAEHALATVGDEGDALRTRLRLTLRTAPPPAALDPLVTRLERGR